MNKRELWENFIRTGKVSDYLKYKNASAYDSSSSPDEEFADELFADDPNLEDFNYDTQDGRYNNP